MNSAYFKASILNHDPNLSKFEHRYSVKKKNLLVVSHRSQDQPTTAYSSYCILNQLKVLISTLKQDLNQQRVNITLQVVPIMSLLPISCYTYCYDVIHEIHVFHHTLKNPSYIVDQRNERLEQESRFPYKKAMHINYSN